MQGIEMWADTRPGTLIVAEGAAVAARDAVAVSGARSLGVVGWNDAVARFARQSDIGVVLAETAGAGHAVLDRTLPHLVGLAHDGNVRIVAVMTAAQIDPVGTHLLASGIDLLCDPSPTERIGALMLAGAVGPATRVHDIVGESEAARLQRLNEEVARIAETLARLTRGDGRGDGWGERPREDQPAAVGDRPLRYAAGPAAMPVPDIAARDIRDVIRARRMRDQMFGGGLFEDPAWDMLLDLFAAELERTQVSVSSLCIAAAVAPTTALRWITRMTEAGLFERHPDPFDRRRAYMALSQRASAGMRDYVAAVRRAGLGLA